MNINKISNGLIKAGVNHVIKGDMIIVHGTNITKKILGSSKVIRDKIIKDLGLPRSKAKWRGHKNDDFIVKYGMDGKTLIISFEGKNIKNLVNEIKKIGKKIGVKVLNIKPFKVVDKPVIKYKVTPKGVTLFIEG